MNKTILFFIIIITAIIGVVGFWHWQGNNYSKDVLKIDILGPESASAGDEIDYLVKFKNNGKVRLENPDLIFQYPENVIPFENPQRITQEIDDIYPGEERVLEFKGRIFGEQGDVAKAQAWLNYKPRNLKARYESETALITQIASIPMTFEFDLPLKVEKGDKINFSLNYFSNVNTVLQNLRIKIQYPDGFEFIKSKPKALDQTDWDLPDIGQADGGRIEISGILDGEQGTKKPFRAQIGIINNNKFILLKQTTQMVEIIEPSLYISELINGSQNYAANVGDLLHYEIFFKNIGKKPIQKKFLFVNLDSDFFDLSTLKSDKGEVGRGDNSIIWDWKKIPKLRFLDAEDEGKVDFWVNVKDGSQGRRIKNPLLESKVSIAGTEKTFQTKINSRINFQQKIVYNDDIFGNYGPLPPVVGNATTYTVLWQVSTTWNNLENIKVKTQLPEYISVTGKFFPEDSKFTYDSQSREIIWSVGNLDAFEGFGEQGPKTLSFQIQFIPNVSQKGTTPILLNNSQILAQDTFTLENIQEQADSVSADLPDDESVSIQQGIVQ